MLEDALLIVLKVIVLFSGGDIQKSRRDAAPQFNHDYGSIMSIPRSPSSIRYITLRNLVSLLFRKRNKKQVYEGVATAS